MKEASREEIPSKETSTIELVIDAGDCPSDDKIQEIIKQIVEKYELKHTTITADVRGGKGWDRTRLVMKAVAVPGGEPTMAALEMFSWMIGNVRIYERVVKYSQR